jgi:pimeloyl-ACP methyl ester carboxylesterase
LDYVLGKADAYDNDPDLNKEIFEANLKTLAPLLASPPPPRIDCAKAATISAPTLVLAGERSIPYYQMIDAEWARCIPGSESMAIPGADHPMSVRNPSAFNQAVLGFLAKHQ